MYLLIENPGEINLDALTILGVSTSRGDEDKIGQFGSGAKMGVLLLMRKGASPTIYSGTTKVEFQSSPAMIDAHIFNKVKCSVGGKSRDMGFALEYGAIDWNDSWMALREFISNAIDSSSFDDVRIELREDTRAKSGVTRVFIPLIPEISAHFNTLKDRFLHFSYQDKVEVLSKPNLSPCKVYRKGVFVRELTHMSLYDYNSPSLEVDECRNCDNWKAEYHIFDRMLGKLNATQWRPLLENLEARINPYTIEVSAPEYYVKVYPALLEAYGGLFGSIPICKPIIYESVKDKSPFYICDGFIFNALKKGGIKTHEDYLSKAENEGGSLCQPTGIMIDTFERCCSFLENLGLRFEKPQLSGFSSISNNATIKAGYYADGTVFINMNREGACDVMLEELGHHITQASDCSIDMQRFGLELAVRSMSYFV